MVESVEAMQIALRVLTALTEKIAPDPADVEALRRLAPSRDHAHLDELACEVIQQALKRRGDSRSDVSQP